MKKVFDSLQEDAAFTLWLKSDPIKAAVFFALHEFVKKGNDLAALPWFALTTFGRRHGQKIAA